jgi:alanine racemase
VVNGYDLRNAPMQADFLSDAVIDLAAIKHNVGVLQSRSSAQIMAVVKANAFGHGAVPVARTALAAGATRLGVSSLAEALVLRAAGLSGPVLAWLHAPEQPVDQASQAGTDLSVSSEEHLHTVAASASRTQRRVAIHLKVDTGLRRNGSAEEDWPSLIAVAARLQAGGSVHVRGIWSHLIYPDQSDHPATAAQLAALDHAVKLARAGGPAPDLVHIANSGAALANRRTHYDMVRAGIGLYGVEPVRGAQFGLVPAMTLRGRVVMTRTIASGDGVSYWHRYTAATSGKAALVALGYADGLPWAAWHQAHVLIGGQRRPVAGAIAMDQWDIDAGTAAVTAGDTAVIFGPGFSGEPTVTEWAAWADTNPHEILARVGPRVTGTTSGRAAPMPSKPFPSSGRVQLVLNFGGPAGEHEVSCASAAAIASHLDPGRYLIRLIYLTKDGGWVADPGAVPAGSAAAQQFRDLTQHELAKARNFPIDALAEADVVVPALHGPFGEDGTIQALLDAAGAPYVGSGMAAMDKDITKRVLASDGIPVTPWVVLRRGDDWVPRADRARLGLPVLVKPARCGSSVGISKVTAWEDLDEAVAAARRWDTKVLVEQAVIGREVDLAVLEHPAGQLQASAALEIRYKPERSFFDYTAKYQDTETDFIIPAPLDRAVAAELEDLALRVFGLLGCRGLARVDFLLADGVSPIVNEVNTFPGFTEASQYPRMWAAEGVGLGELLDRLIDTTLNAAPPGGRP